MKSHVGRVECQGSFHSMLFPKHLNSLSCFRRESCLRQVKENQTVIPHTPWKLSKALRIPIPNWLLSVRCATKKLQSSKETGKLTTWLILGMTRSRTNAKFVIMDLHSQEALRNTWRKFMVYHQHRQLLLKKKSLLLWRWNPFSELLNFIWWELTAGYLNYLCPFFIFIFV